MTLTASILAVAAFLCAAVIGGFALIVLGIHKGDRAIRLADEPSTQVEAITRRILGIGIRTASNAKDEIEEF